MLVLSSWAQERDVFKGRVLDKASGQALPYSNITVQGTNRGSISNEEGFFSINIEGLSPKDSLLISFIGFKTQKIAVNRTDTFRVINLEEDLINLDETFVFGGPPEAKDIIKKMLEKKPENYPSIYKKSKVFIRDRNATDILDFSMKMKKSSFKGFNKNILKEIEEKTPRHSLSYSDFLGDLYFPGSENTGIKLKPTQLIELREKSPEASEELNKVLTEMLKETSKDEYWKIKSGIFSQRADFDADINDTTNTKQDTIDLSNKKEHFDFASYIRWKHDAFIDLDNEEQWDFLHERGDYNYTLNSGTRINNEDVYIIDFTPKKSGKFEGRLYIAMQSYALIRADFKYASGKHGFSIKLLGVGYRKTNFSGSVLFEKLNGAYQVKYFAYSTNQNISVERPVSLLKKRERFLFDKTLNQLKIKLVFVTQQKESVEMFFLENEAITKQEWDKFTPKKYIDVKYVNQFSDDNWKGYSIIEPTQKMREYKKRAEE